jgi:hypothetical protein
MVYSLSRYEIIDIIFYETLIALVKVNNVLLRRIGET